MKRFIGKSRRDNGVGPGLTTNETVFLGLTSCPTLQWKGSVFNFVEVEVGSNEGVEESRGTGPWYECGDSLHGVWL
ncbi:hypothetical protein N7539_008533 [Penicillium diatomitis]|uniref:Uncharacterized protein n=1 Tax=Penicillium diatomitis TaxID=2819901 RepID=A0A9W9WQV6_9EURO|nr:uncharacterized protein N7539_008533 [Penicillium diatomitis]KAJ5471964.1 hypothetical protein N7539_008533 [Penicillium diatomitis]